MWKFTVTPRDQFTEGLVSQDDIIETVKALTSIWCNLSEPLRKLVEHVGIGWEDCQIGELNGWFPCPKFTFRLDKQVSEDGIIVQSSHPLTGRGKNVDRCVSIYACKKFADSATKDLLGKVSSMIREREDRNQKVSEEITDVLARIDRKNCSFP